jgi:PAS domain S-box-containing protein
MNIDIYKEIMAKAPIAYALNELIFNSAREAIDYRFIEINKPFEVLIGLKADQITGRRAGEVFQDFDHSIFNRLELYAKIVLKNETERLELFDEALKKWYYLYTYAIGDNYFVSIFNDITAEKENQETIKRNELRFRGLIESQTDLIVRVDHQNRFSFVNEVYCKTFGKSHDELMGQSFFPLIHPDDREATGRAMENLRVAPYRCRLEQRAMTVDGWRWFVWEDYAILDKNGDIAEIQGVGRDITAEKELTNDLINSQKRLSLAQSFANTGSWDYQIETGKLFWSAECEKLFGVPEGTFGGTFDDFLSKVHPADKELVVAANKPITELKEGQPLNYEHRIVKPDGEVRWVKETAGVVKDKSGKPLQIVGFVMDITEQKVAAEAIENQTNLQQIAENIDGVFWIRSADRKKMHYLSPGFENIFGIAPETIFDDPDAFMKVVFEADKERIAKAYDVFMITGEFQEEYRIVKPNGEIRWIVSNAFPVRNDHGEIIRYAGIVNDITDRKQSEIAISEQAHKLNTLIEALPDMIFIMHRDGTILDIFGADPEKLIAPQEQLTGTSIKNCFEKSEFEKHLTIYNHCLENNESAIIKFDLEINGTTLNFESRLKPMNSDTLLTIVRDVTQENILSKDRQEEVSLRQFLFENSKDGLVILNDEHRVVDANLRFAEMLGYTLEELKNLNTWDFEADHDEQDIRKNFGLKGDLSMTFETRHRRKDGTFYNAEVSIKNFEWKGSRLVLCSVRDITGRKQAEMEIKDSEEKYRMLFNANNDSISVFYIDENGMPSDFVEMNEAGAKIIGYTNEELLKTNVGQIEATVSDEVRLKRIEEIKQYGHATFETTMRHKSGKLMEMEVKTILIRYKGKPAILNIARDITGRKKAEEALKASEYKFRHLVNNLNAGIVIHNPDTTIRFSNPQAASLLGITQDQLDGKDALDPDWKFLDAQGNELKPEDYPVSKVIDTKKAIKDKVYGINRPSIPDRVWVQVNAYPEFDQNGELLQAVITFIDISDIKRAEEGLSESLEFNRRLLATIPDLVIRTDLEGNIVFVNEPGTKGTFFYTKEELIGRNMLSFIHETDLQRAVENTKLMFEKPLGIKEYKLKLDDGQVLDYEVNGDVVRDSDNNPVGMIYIVRNITERKRAEAAILRGKQRLESFLEISREIAATLDQEKIMQMVVDNAIRIMGLGSGAIYLQNDEETIVLAATSPALPDNFPDVFRSTSLADHPHIKKTITTGNFVFLPDSSSAELTTAEQEFVKLRGLRSNLYLPIRLRNITIGVLILSSVGETYHFTNEEINLLQGFANQAAHIIDNVNNFARLKKYAAELEQQIAQRKEAEDLIRQNEERFRQVAETSQAVIWEINTAGVYTYVSPMAEKIWGYKPEDLVGRLSYFDLHPDEGRYDFRDETMKLLTQKKSFNDLENPIQKQDGSIIWVSSNGLPVFDEHGEHSGYRGSDQDITGRKRAEIALRESELFANTIANNTPALLYIYDLEKRKNIWVNEVHRRTFEQLNLDSSNIKYDVVSDFLHPEDFLGLLEKTGQIVTPEGADSFQMEIRLKWDDKWKWMNALVTVFKRNENGQGVQILGALFDIDDRKTAEEELRKFKTISDQANYGTAMADLHGNLIYLNEAFAKMHGRTIDECIGRSYEIFHNKNQLPKAKAIIKKVLDIGSVTAFEMNHVTKSGKVFPTLMSVSLIRDKIDQPRFFAVSAIDISEYKNAQTEVLKLSQAVVQSPVSILITNINGNIEYVNPRFTEISGYQPEEVLGQNPRFLKSGHHQPEEYQKLWETILSGKIWQGEILNRKKNGQQFWENVSISPVMSQDGTITHFIAIKDDITERKKMVEDLVKAKEKAEESDKLKTSFINNINHEIRTPLNGILGFGQILTQQNLPASEKEEYYKILQDSTDRLIQTVTDYMDISMLHAGLVHLKPNSFVVDELINEIKVKILKPCQAKGIDLFTETPNETGSVMLDGDREHLHKALSHIVINAEKFTRKGSIKIGYSLNESIITFYVNDTGKGINPEKLNNMFKAFEQEDSSNTRGHEGSGLGLAIAKEIIDLFNGTIEIESEVGKGTKVIVKIPFVGSIEQPAELPEMVGAKHDANETIILIAEDIEENYFYLKVILGKAGYLTLHAENGLEAVEMCKAYPEISLVLMDIKMPVMDGMEATRRIKEFRSDLPVIAVTAYAKTGDEYAIREAGYNELIAKPISKEILLLKIAKLLIR